MAESALEPTEMGKDAGTFVDFFCFLNNLSELRILTTFYFAKHDHRWVNFITLKTIADTRGHVWLCLREPSHEQPGQLRRGDGVG